jgi:L-ascorbate metabolism protein UlaG (beta-lactamase superfamily)
MAMTIVGAMCGCTAQNVEDSEKGCDVFKTQKGTTVKMYCIKHGSLRMQVGEKWIYVDPVTTAVKPVTDYSTLPKADYILVTHEHFDHLDSVAINQLSKEGTVLITNARCHELLGGKGDVMANGDTRILPEEWVVEAVPAYNHSPQKLQFHPKGRDNGFVLTIEDMRIYIAGDTEDIPEMDYLKDIDVAFLPCNLPYTMAPDQCAHAARMIKPTVLFPYHYGETDIQQVVKLLEGSGIDVRIRDYQ